VISRQGTTLALEVPVTTFDGTLTLFLEHQETMGGRGRMTLAIAGAGLLVAVLVSLAGVVLGWWWLRPIQRLATACRATGDDAPDLATDSGLREADRLAHAFNQRLAIERRARQHLAEALEREATAHAVQRRFLANLGHELGQPLHRLIGLTSRLTAQAQPPAPEQLSELRLCAVALDERFQEILGLVGESAVEPGLGQRLHLRRYLAGLIDQLQPQAQAKGLELAGVAPDEECFIPTRLLTPVLVNLAANALRATNAGRVTLSVEVQPGSIVWTVSDTGPGIEAALAERITDSCRRGEVMPGTTGLGLGLTMAMANLRSLGGRLELAANGPQGVCFRATVPVM
jgi:signal transduction histidine kinase